MKLLKIATSLPLLLAAPLLMAASQVELYGIVDGGLYVKKTSGKDTTIGIDSGRKSGSRWGLRGSEDLGNGYTVSFKLENGFKLDNGEMDQASAAAPEGRMFGREATLNFHTPYGTIGMGRMGGLLSGMGTYGLMVTNSSPFAAAWSDAKYNLLFTGNNRYDNTIAYKSPTFNNLTLYAQYSFNADGPEYEKWRDNSEMASVAATYISGPLKVVGGVQWRDTGISKKLTDEVVKDNSATQRQKNALMAATSVSYDFGTWKLYTAAQLLHGAEAAGTVMTASGKRGEKGLDGYALSLGANVKLYGGDLKAAVAYADGEDKGKTASYGDYEAVQSSLGYLYPLSKRTSVYTVFSYWHVRKVHKTVATNSVTDNFSFALGLSHKF